MSDGIKDVGPKAIDFGNGEAKGFPKDPGSRKRPDAEVVYSEFAQLNKGRSGENAMKISAKDNGGEKAGKSEGGM